MATELRSPVAGPPGSDDDDDDDEKKNQKKKNGPFRPMPELAELGRQMKLCKGVDAFEILKWDPLWKHYLASVLNIQFFISRFPFLPLLLSSLVAASHVQRM